MCRSSVCTCSKASFFSQYHSTSDLGSSGHTSKLFLTEYPASKISVPSSRLILSSDTIVITWHEYQWALTYRALNTLYYFSYIVDINTYFPVCTQFICTRQCYSLTSSIHIVSKASSTKRNYSSVHNIETFAEVLNRQLQRELTLLIGYTTISEWKSLSCTQFSHILTILDSYFDLAVSSCFVSTYTVATLIRQHQFTRKYCCFCVIFHINNGMSITQISFLADAIGTWQQSWQCSDGTWSLELVHTNFENRFTSNQLEILSTLSGKFLVTQCSTSDTVRLNRNSDSYITQ